MIKISIIMPVYNCGQYLRQSIQSVQSQTLKELELICVDDGSVDNSAEIIQQFQMTDSRIRLYQQDNQGAGAARNLGIGKAQGKYLAFLDADDYYLDENALEVMYGVCVSHGAAACGSRRKRIQNGAVIEDSLFQDTEKNVLHKYENFQLDYDYQNFLFLRKNLMENHILFPPYRRFQDPPFLVKALYEAKEFVVADTYLYGYRVPDIAARFDRKKTLDLLQGLTDNLLFARERHLQILFENTLRRLEYEYEIVICRAAVAGNQEVFEKLNRANQIVRRHFGRDDYVIRPLRILEFDLSPYQKKMIEILKANDEIVLYGAGIHGRIFLDFVKKQGFLKKVKAFAVSKLQGNQSSIGGIPVRLLGKNDAFVFVTAPERAQQEIAEFLDKNGNQNYELVRTEFIDLISGGEGSCITGMRL